MKRRSFFQSIAAAGVALVAVFRGSPVQAMPPTRDRFEALFISDDEVPPPPSWASFVDHVDHWRLDELADEQRAIANGPDREQSLEMLARRQFEPFLVEEAVTEAALTGEP